MPTAQLDSRASLALRASPVRALRDLLVEEDDTTVVLRGIVTSYYMKQQALEAIKPLLAGRCLLNHVEVHCPE